MEATQSTSPKKRLSVDSKKTPTPRSITKNKFIYGNYSRYYGYRNLKDDVDPRIDAFLENKHLWDYKDVLDIGCNSGMITTELGKKTFVKHISGIDIDKTLIQRSTNQIKRLRKGYMGENNNKEFPFNVSFISGNYVLRDDVLLEIERPQFDVILCLSVTKWLHLNFGDKGLKQAFKRMFLQLRDGGKLILEAQPFESYKRRKKLTNEIFENYKSINLFPKDFEKYLLSDEIGFKSVSLLEVNKHAVKGFQRPIQIFEK
ncbi:MEPCE.2 family protein [Megaselia abdita]